MMNDLVEVFPRLPRALWARLYLPSLVTESDRAVFADIDVAVIQDLSPLWSLPLNGSAVGAVRDAGPGPAKQLSAHYPHLERYFNAGVMAIDVPAWQQHRLAVVGVDDSHGDGEHDVYCELLSGHTLAPLART